MPTLFTKIINGEIPSYKIYEDEFTFAFLDIHPEQIGHTLVIPKIETDYFVNVPEPFYTAVFQTAKKIAPAVDKATNCLRVGMMVQGVDVPHFHIHLIPIFKNKSFLGGGLNLSKQEFVEIQNRIIQNLE